MSSSPLLGLFDLCFKEGKLPGAWKKADLIPIPEPNGGYRPVSLISCISKMMERIILNGMIYILGDNLSCNLYGFSNEKSKVDGVIKCQSTDADKCRVLAALKDAFDKAHGEVI